jgi:serine/threonine-protein kinase
LSAVNEQTRAISFVAPPRDPSDLTFIGAATPPVAGGGRPPFDAESDPPGVDVEETGRGSAARRRLGRALIVLIAVLAATAGAFAAVAAAKPSYAVPRVTAMSPADARRVVAEPEKFKINEQKGTYYDEDMPAGQILEQAPGPGLKLKQGGAITVRLSDGPTPRAVPDLTGKTRTDAQAAIGALGLKFVSDAAKDEFSDTVAKDVAIDWTPHDGKVAKGSTVTVKFSKGPQPKDIPSFTDQLYDAYQKALEALGFKVKKAEDFSDRVDQGQIIKTTPAAGSAAQPGTEVTVTVSKGPDEVAIPDVRGMSIADAMNALQQAGLRVGGPYGPDNARRAYDTTPSPGNKVKRGTTVDLYVGR